MKKQLIAFLLVAMLAVMLLVGCGDAELLSVTVTKQPDKVDYEVGETFQVAGAKLEVTYSDGTTEEVEITSSMISSPVVFTTKGKKNIEITFTYGEVTKTATIVINVKDTLGDARAIAITEINGYQPTVSDTTIISTEIAANAIRLIRETSILKLDTAANTAEIDAIVADAKAQIDGIARADKDAAKNFLNVCIDTLIWNAPEGYPTLDTIPGSGITAPEQIPAYIEQKTGEMALLKAAYAAKLDAATTTSQVMGIVAEALAEIDALPTYAELLAPYYVSRIDAEFAKYDKWAPYIENYESYVAQKIYDNNRILVADSVEQIKALFDVAYANTLKIKTPADTIVETMYDLNYPLVLTLNDVLPATSPFMMLAAEPDPTWDTYTILMNCATKSEEWFTRLSTENPELQAELMEVLENYDTNRIPFEEIPSEELRKELFVLDEEGNFVSGKTVNMIELLNKIQARAEQLVNAREEVIAVVNPAIADAMAALGTAEQAAKLEAAKQAYETWVTTYEIDEPNKAMATDYVKLLYRSELQALINAVGALPQYITLTDTDKDLIEAARAISNTVNNETYMDGDTPMVGTMFKPEYQDLIQPEDRTMLETLEATLSAAEERYAQLLEAKANADTADTGVNALIQAVVDLGDLSTANLATLKNTINAARSAFDTWFAAYEIDDNGNGVADIVDAGAGVDANVMLIVTQYDKLLEAEAYYAENRVDAAAGEVAAPDTGLNALIDALVISKLTDIKALEEVEAAVAQWAETYGIVLDGDNKDTFHITETGLKYDDLCAKRAAYNTMYETAKAEQAVIDAAITNMPANITLADKALLDAAMTPFTAFVNTYLTVGAEQTVFEAYEAYVTEMTGFVSANAFTATNILVEGYEKLKAAYEGYAVLAEALAQLKADILAFAPNNQAIITLNHKVAIEAARADFNALTVMNNNVAPTAFMEEEYALLVYAEAQLLKLEVDDAANKASDDLWALFGEVNTLIGANRASEGGDALYNKALELQSKINELKLLNTDRATIEKIEAVVAGAEEAFAIAIRYLVVTEPTGTVSLYIFAEGVYSASVVRDIEGNHPTSYDEIVITELVGNGHVELVDFVTDRLTVLGGGENTVVLKRTQVQTVSVEKVLDEGDEVPTVHIAGGSKVTYFQATVDARVIVDADADMTILTATSWADLTFKNDKSDLTVIASAKGDILNHEDAAENVAASEAYMYLVCYTFEGKTVVEAYVNEDAAKAALDTKGVTDYEDYMVLDNIPGGNISFDEEGWPTIWI